MNAPRDHSRPRRVGRPELTTQARIGLGRAGNSLPTTRVLEFAAAHAAARDAVHDPLDVDAFVPTLADLGLGDPLRCPARPAPAANTCAARTSGDNRRTAPNCPRRRAISASSGGRAVAAGARRPRPRHDLALLDAFDGRYTIAPPVIATQARVALGDHIAAALGVTTLIVIIGERPDCPSPTVSASISRTGRR